MKKLLLLASLLLLLFTGHTQNPVQAFEKVIREGNSEKAFEFVRNMFELPALQDPFLHFKKRGITKLISFCDHAERRIEATSLIRFNQTREFWKNYSQQFTAGKFNYKTLYKTDSLAWQAANYSITLIYAHEMGHYMSYRFINHEYNSYTCEEVVANECLSAFANAFNGNKRMDEHKKLFIELCRQTAALIPDSNKTAFGLPMEKWCEPNPMNGFFAYYESDETTFLRLYGYLQFRMMEHLLTTPSAEVFHDFLNRKFYSFHAKKTGKHIFKPLRYKIVKEDTVNNGPYTTFRYYKISDSTYCYKTVFYDDDVVHLGKNGEIFSSVVQKEKIYPDAEYKESAYDLERFTVWNNEMKGGSLTTKNGLLFFDSALYNSFFIRSATIAENSFWYLFSRRIAKYSFRLYETEGINTDSLDQLKDSTINQFLYLEPAANNMIKYRQFTLPDSFNNYTNTFYRDLNLAGYNNFGAALVSNEYQKDGKHRLTIYPVDTLNLAVEEPLWQYQADDGSFFNMEIPSLYIDTTSKTIHLAFYNPVTEKIHLISIKENKWEACVLYNSSSGNVYGPQMKISALRLTAPNKLLVLASCRAPGNYTKTERKKLLLQW